MLYITYPTRHLNVMHDMIDPLLQITTKIYPGRSMVTCLHKQIYTQFSALVEVKARIYREHCTRDPGEDPLPKVAVQGADDIDYRVLYCYVCG